MYLMWLLVCCWFYSPFNVELFKSAPNRKLSNINQIEAKPFTHLPVWHRLKPHTRGALSSSGLLKAIDVIIKSGLSYKPGSGPEPLPLPQPK